MSHPIEITDATFDQEVVKADTVVLVDFWAEWCGPCKIIAPIVEDLAKEYDGKVKFTKLDVDSNPRSATNFGIRGIPTLLIFKDGKPVDQVVGAVPKSVLKKRLEEALVA
jgi:thioredoxin 1